MQLVNYAKNSVNLLTPVFFTCSNDAGRPGKNTDHMQ